MPLIKHSKHMIFLNVPFENIINHSILDRKQLSSVKLGKQEFISQRNLEKISTFVANKFQSKMWIYQISLMAAQSNLTGKK